MSLSAEPYRAPRQPRSSNTICPKLATDAHGYTQIRDPPLKMDPRLREDDGMLTSIVIR